MNYKEFDLEAAKNGEKLITRDGRPARIVCWDLKNDRPLVAVVEHNGEEYCIQVTLEGRLLRSCENQADLFMAPTKYKGWVNVHGVYGHFTQYCTGARIYNTQEEADADAARTGNRVACVHIEWEE